MTFLTKGGDAFRTIEAKTGSTYRMKPEDLGKLFTNRGASALVTFTLPITGDIQVGWWVDVFTAAATEIIVASHVTDTMTTFNDLTADSVSFSTVSEIIGGGWRFVWDGTGWLVMIMAEETQTMTIVTA